MGTLNASLYTALLEPGEEIVHHLAVTRKAWLQVARGKLLLNGQVLNQGDGAAVSDEEFLQIVGQEAAEVLLFDLA